MALAAEPGSPREQLWSDGFLAPAQLGTKVTHRSQTVSIPTLARDGEGMVRARDLLDRFRPVGGPGAATVVGVPADRRAEITHELEPVLALLDDVATECSQLRAQADRDASRIREAGLERVAQIQASGREQARAARAEEAARAQQRVEAEHERALAEGAREAAAVLERARTRQQALVDSAVAALLPVNATARRRP
jgi:hypothetical protein